MSETVHQMTLCEAKRRAQITDLMLKGVRSPGEIALRLNASLALINNDIACIRQEWHEQYLQNRDTLFAEELQRIHLIERAAWEGWEASKAPEIVKKNTVAETIGDKPDGDAKPVTTRQRRIREKQITTKDGDWHFLEILQWAMIHRAKITGMLVKADLEASTSAASVTIVLPDEQKRQIEEAVRQQFGSLNPRLRIEENKEADLRHDGTQTS